MTETNKTVLGRKNRLSTIPEQVERREWYQNERDEMLKKVFCWLIGEFESPVYTSDVLLNCERCYRLFWKIQIYRHGLHLGQKKLLMLNPFQITSILTTRRLKCRTTEFQIKKREIPPKPRSLNHPKAVLLRNSKVYH